MYFAKCPTDVDATGLSNVIKTHAATMMRQLLILLLFLPALAASFVPQAHTRIGWHIYAHEDEEEPKLMLGDGVDELMKSLKSKFPTSEADYLAAARKRAEEARPSVNSNASDEDWQKISAQKSLEEDDWETSLKEAGSDESQILIPLAPTDNDEGEKPKLLLF